MELKYLQTLKAILQTGSFQNAARQLNYTQSTVTFQIQQLEQALSVKLFEKVGRRMRLTQAGKELLPYVEGVLQSVERLVSYGQERREPAGTLRVSLPETLLTYQIQPLLKAFREQAPLVNLVLQVLPCSGIRDQILQGEADVAIHYEVGGYGMNVVTEGLAKPELVLVSSPELSRENRDFTTLKQRKALCLIQHDRESIFKQIFSAYLKERDILVEQRLELGSVEAIKQSVMNNLGVSLLPRFAVKAELRAGLLEELSTGPLESFQVILAYHKNKWISPAMALFMHLVKTELPVF